MDKQTLIYETPVKNNRKHLTENYPDKSSIESKSVEDTREPTTRFRSSGIMDKK